MLDSSRAVRRALYGVGLLLAATPAAAQVTPAAGGTPPDDTPKVSIGATIFADYTIQQQPKVTDADGNTVTSNSFNIGRSYINITGNISHLIAFRITPDIARETGAGSSLNGSYTFRLKYAFAQFNLDDWMTHGSWVRLGVQQTPFVDFEEAIYRYRFQGTVFAEREAFLTSSDAGASLHYNLANNYGDIHAGVYNGEGYSRAEANSTKAFQVRGTLRPLPRHPVLRGLRLTGFYDADAYVKNADKRRADFLATFEHPFVNAGFEYLATKDQTSVTKPTVNGKGWSIWATPKTQIGWEALLRYDRFEPGKGTSELRQREIGGVAYWFPHQGNVATALLFDVDNATFANFSTPQPTQRRFALHGLVNF